MEATAGRVLQIPNYPVQRVNVWKTQPTRPVCSCIKCSRADFDGIAADGLYTGDVQSMQEPDRICKTTEELPDSGFRLYKRCRPWSIDVALQTRPAQLIAPLSLAASFHTQLE